jgi:hypothetical protein
LNVLGIEAIGASGIVTPPKLILVVVAPLGKMPELLGTAPI